MIKGCLLVILALLIAAYFWLIGHMESRGMPWSAFGEIKELMLMSALVGGLVIGFIILLIAQYAITRITTALNAQYEIDKANHEQSVTASQKEESDRLARQESALRERNIQLDQAHLDQVQETKEALAAKEQELEDAIEAAEKKKGKYKKLIILTNAENEAFRQKALTASKMLERYRRKEQKASSS